MQLGKFTLRDEGRTIGFGEVLRVKPAQVVTNVTTTVVTTEQPVVTGD